MDDILKKLFEPDNLKYMVPSLVALCSIISALISLITASYIASKTYHLGRKAKIDDVRINRSYKLAEKLAFSIKTLEFTCNNLELLWEENYGHINSFDEKINAFKKVQPTSMIQLIEEYIKERENFLALIQKSHIYLSENILKSAQSYFDIGQFKYTNDSMGIVNDFYDKFFKNLLELDTNKNSSQNCFNCISKNDKQRTVFYKKTMKELKKF